MTEETKRPACLAPWLHLHIDTVGEMRPCCIAGLAIKTDSIEEGWNSPEMKDLRVRMMAGEIPPDHCARCIKSNRFTVHSLTFDWEAEKHNISIDDILSATKDDGETTFVPISLDLRTHLCNLKCRTCSGFASSSIRSERIKFKLPIQGYETTKLSNITLADLPFIDNVKKIYWAGGEPFMSPLHWEVMDHLHESGNHPFIFYSTNATFPGKTLDRAIELLSNFPTLELNISIDGMGEYGDYVRSGINTSEVWKNVKTIKERLPHAKLKIDTTITNCGIMTLEHLVGRTRDLGIGWMGHLLFKSPHNRFLCEKLLKPEVFEQHLWAARQADPRPASKKSFDLIESAYSASVVTAEDFFECDRYEDTRGMKGFFNDRILPFLNQK